LVTTAGASTKIRFVVHVPAVDYRLSKSRPGVCGIERTLTSAKRVQACTEAALRSASELGSGAPVTVAIPLLGAGAGGLSPAVACRAMIEGVRAFLREEPSPPLDAILFAIPEGDRFELCAKLVHDAFG